MPATLDLIAKTRDHLQPLLRPLSPLLPLARQPLTGRYAHNHNVRGNVQPNGGYTGFSFRGGRSPTTSPPGCRRPATARSTSASSSTATATSRTTTARRVPPGWECLVLRCSSVRHRPLLLRLPAQRQRPDRRARSATRGAGKPANTASATTSAARSRRPTGCPATTSPTTLTNIATERDAGDAGRTGPSTSSSTTRPRTATSADPPAPSRRRATTTGSRGAQLPHDREEGLDEGNVTDKPQLHPRSRPPDAERAPHLPHLLRRSSSSRCATSTTASGRSSARSAQLGGCSNTYVIFISDNGFFFGEHRLLGGKFLAYEPATHLPLLIRGPGIKPNSSTGELAANIDIAPTVLELAGAEADKSIDGRSLVPFMRDPDLRSRRPILFESFVETSDVEAQGAIAIPGDQSGAPSTRSAAGTAAAAPGLAAGAAQGLRGDPARPLQVHRLADGREGALRHQPRPVRAQLAAQGPQLLPDPQLPPPRNAAADRMRRQGLPEVSRRIPADPQGSAAARRPRSGAKCANASGRRTNAGTARTAKAARGRNRRTGPSRRTPYSMTARTSPLETAAPSATLREVTLPERWAAISFSIFIASITQIRSPSATSAPCSTATLSTVPCSGEGSDSLEALRRRRRLALAFRRLAAARRRRPRDPPATASPITLTSKSLPETSTL